MPPRQVWLFEFGCWAALLTAVVHLVGHLAGPPAPVDDAGRQLAALAASYRYALPGGAERSLMDLVDGLGLSVAMLLAGIGGIGLAVARRAYEDGILMVAVARAAAVTGAVLVAISLTHFFIVPSLCLAMMTVAFALASVRR